MFAKSYLQRLNWARSITACTLRKEKERRFQGKEDIPQRNREEQNHWQVTTEHTQGNPPAFTPEATEAA